MDPNFLKLELYFIQIPQIVISLLQLTYLDYEGSDTFYCFIFSEL